MERELESRVEVLEAEVRALRAELAELRQTPEQATKSQIHQKVFTVEAYEKVTPKVTEEVNEAEQTEPIIAKSNVTQPAKPKRTLEETVTKALPKVFMVILVLGVLWGLKLISDYGYLSDSVKILLAFVLSIGLGTAAYMMEKKDFGSPPVTISLYGGAFIVGILTTAAGAILYDVLSLTIALVIALCYIAYGIAISYVKGNEILTIFVVFTSLLLPYLLEYMDFNSLFIMAFVILLFAAMQFVILKHQQKIAFYIATFFSVIATFIVWTLQLDNNVFFVIGTIAVLAIFLASWWRLYDKSENYKTVQEGLLFGFSGFTMLCLNILLLDVTFAEGYLMIALALFVGAVFIMYKEKQHRVFDITATIALLIVFNIFLVLNLPDGYDVLIFASSAFAGMMLGIRLRAPVMKVIYSLLLGLIALIIFTVEHVVPFWQLGHLTLVLLLIFMTVAYIFAKRPKNDRTRFEELMEKYFVMDGIAVGIVLFFMLYIVKLDFAYFSIGDNLPYVFMMVIAIAAISSYLVDRNWFGEAVPVVLTAFYFMSVFILIVSALNNSYYDSLNILARIISLVVLLALLADLYQEGLIYKKWHSLIEKYVDEILSSGIILAMFQVMSLITYFNHVDMIAWGIAVTGNTFSIFIAASIALMLGMKKQWRYTKYTGFGLLIFAILKLIFFDLSSLDLLIRAVLFITVGGAGMVLSSRLLKK
ncbi:DUF2339 domain-containing protein [Solibacillus sp. CAU 1738]|uniref:DUF2339 domain-containing protein n=1 Tax=Solibacillus sp. CAU 1738 TaxID=3140363 RepID=UPI003260C02D